MDIEEHLQDAAWRRRNGLDPVALPPAEMLEAFEHPLPPAEMLEVFEHRQYPMEYDTPAGWSYPRWLVALAVASVLAFLWAGAIVGGYQLFHLR